MHCEQIFSMRIRSARKRNIREGLKNGARVLSNQPDGICRMEPPACIIMSKYDISVLTIERLVFFFVQNKRGKRRQAATK